MAQHDGAETVITRYDCGVGASTGVHRGQIVFRERDYHGTTVHMHVSCAEKYDENPNFSPDGYGASLVDHALRDPWKVKP